MADQNVGNTSLDEALREFELVFMPSRNWSAKTRRSYHFDLTDLVTFLRHRGKTTPPAIDLFDLEAYLADLDRRGLKGTSRRRRVYAIKSFVSFLRDSGLVSNNVAQRLIPPKAEKKEPRVLSQAEYRALLDACRHQVRDAAIIELLLQTGIRLSEIARLTINDVELPRRINQDPGNVGILRVIGKGNKSRTIPLNYKACRALRAWLDIRPAVNHDSFFVTKFREPMGARSFQYLVDKYLKEAGIRGASVHSLRHTFATHHVASGTSLRSVQEALGHADLKTTAIYVALAKEVMRKELQEHAL
jgi:site-specific recombinase XerD